MFAAQSEKPHYRPFGLLAELTYRCPLHCPYCSNPLNLSSYSDELALDEWVRVFTEARTLGVLQLHLSGGKHLPSYHQALANVLTLTR